MDRQIVCFGIPSLDIALARLHHTQLRTHPLVIADVHSPQSLIREVSREAEEDGVAVGMPVDRARRFCPTLRICPPNLRASAMVDRSITAVIQRYAPTWEPVLPGSVMLDLTGTTRLFGSACDVAARVQAEVLAQWREDMRTDIIVAAAMLAAIVLLAALIMHQFALRSRMVAEPLVRGIHRGA